MFTHEDHFAVAEIICKLQREFDRAEVAKEFAKLFKGSDPKFNVTKFLMACRVERIFEIKKHQTNLKNR